MQKISMKAARVAAGLTQQEMADKLGVTRSTVNLWENGKLNMKKANFIAFCAVAGFEEDDIFLPVNIT